MSGARGASMTEQQYFVRMRGKVAGPYSVAELRTLHARGQLGRFVEVSADQVSWTPAGAVQGLFPGAVQPAPPPPEAVETPPGGTNEAGIVPATVVERAAGAAEWYYLDRRDAQQGPVSLDDLRRLLDDGEIDPATYACKPGMSQWVEVRSLEGMERQGGGSRARSLRGGRALSSQTWLLVACVAAPILGVAGVAV